MNRQRGATFLGMMFIAVLVVIVAILGLKLVPAYIEYATISNILRDVANSPEGKSGNVPAIQASFRKHAQIDAIETVKSDDLEIDKDGDRVIIKAPYSVKVKLAGNVSALIDFVATSGN
jgi:Tfp pilus assembly major pilin PilA